MRKITRRRFLRDTALLSAGVASSKVLPSFSRADEQVRGAAPAVKRVLADMHVHPTMNDWLAHAPPGLSSPGLIKSVVKELNPTGCTWRDMHAAGVDLVCVAHFNFLDEWLSMPTDPSPVAPARTRRMMDLLESYLDPERDGRYAAYGRMVRSGAELEEALRRRPSDPGYRVAVVHSLEGGHALGGNKEEVADFARRGVAYITVTHFFNKGLSSAPNAFPFFPDAFAGPPHQGMSALGKSVVAEMEEHGVLVDVTHMTSRALDELLPCVQRPVIASHASMRVLGEHPYSLHDDHALAIAAGGGLIGVILYPYILSNYTSIDLADEKGSIADVVETVLYLIDLCGDHRRLAVGTDYGGFIHGPRDLPSLRYIGRLSDALRRVLPSDQVVQDIMADNLIGFLKKHWGPDRA